MNNKIVILYCLKKSRRDQNWFINEHVKMNLFKFWKVGITEFYCVLCRRTYVLND